ncbi:MAG: transglutaminase-like domain-containing protein, partial [Planctomycetaceae bacterium]|nr:transglutaminase-like domain-containing protein [Planctomycetaceae bacterium]
LAAEATESNNRSWEMAAELERFVSRKLQQVSYQHSFASAAEVAETLQGDSAGYAVLLAAIARAKNIPSRVVVGLVYTDTNTNEGVFVPHFWTELFLDGHWHPFDATIGQGGADASRILLARSNLADESLPALVAKTLPLLGHLQVTIVKIE